jgi:hypothetical protein
MAIDGVFPRTVMPVSGKVRKMLSATLARPIVIRVLSTF